MKYVFNVRENGGVDIQAKVPMGKKFRTVATKVDSEHVNLEGLVTAINEVHTTANEAQPIFVTLADILGVDR